MNNAVQYNLEYNCCKYLDLPERNENEPAISKPEEFSSEFRVHKVQYETKILIAYRYLFH